MEKSRSLLKASMKLEVGLETDSKNKYPHNKENSEGKE